MDVTFTPLEPWTFETRAAVADVAYDMAELDRREIMGLRPQWHGPSDVVRDMALLIAGRRVLDGFIAWRGPKPVAVAMAFLSSMPKVADVALFGREGQARAMPAVYLELASRMVSFGPRHRISLVQVPILTEHRAARRMARSLGGEAVFDYGPIGTHGQSYTHTIWRL